jgi:predicted phosphate transport protein (TIGR00153 family)
MLITSRETRRWVVPKGNPIRGLAPHEAAAHEAFEEAGLHGIACPTALGSYRYRKRRRDGTMRNATVDLFPFSVLSQAEDWPEQDERETRWFSLTDAVQAVEEADLKALIASFRQPGVEDSPLTRALAWLREWGAERIPMLRWFHALMPKRGRFFDQFEEHGATLVAGADALAQLFQGGPDIAEHVREIQDREHEADNITRDVLLDVRRTFVTPFDRSAITDLIGVMDDAIDQMNQTAKAVTLYEVTTFEPQMRAMTGIVVEAARVTAEALPLLRSIRTQDARLHELTERLVEIEGHADDIHDEGLKALFRTQGERSPMDFIVGREIYSHLEKIVDRFEDVANEIEGLVIDHA